MPEFMHVEILAFVGLTREQGAVFTAEERDVQDQNDFSWPMYLLRNDDCIESLGDRSRRDANIFAELSLYSSALYEFFPKLCGFS